MEIEPKLPAYVRFCFKLILVLLIVFAFSISKSILLPLIFSILLAIMLLRANTFLERKKVPRVIAILLTLILSVICITGILYFLSAQIAGFTDNMAGIQKNLENSISTFQKWIANTFHFTIRQQQDYLNDTIAKLEGGGYIRQTFITLTQEIVVLILIPVYTFLILYYRDKIKIFLITVFQKTNADKTTRILKQSRAMIESYMLGLLIEMVILAILTSVGLMIIGVKFAIFLGVLCAILNLIPYLGIIIAGIFTLFVSLGTSKELSDLIWISILFLVIHNIDSNILKTIIVGSKVRINALVTIIGIVIGNALSGLSGMFLAIPALAILKIICDQVDELKPWGILLGEKGKGAEEVKLLARLKRIRTNAQAEKDVGE